MGTHRSLRRDWGFLFPLAAVVAASAACTEVEAQESPPGAPVSPDALAEMLPLTPAAAHGREAYRRWCVGCHGEDGRGDGEATRLGFLDPLPRNFQIGQFKFRSTPSGELPTRDDLVRTITRGLRGSSMPAFPLLPEAERRHLAEYVLHLAQLGRLRIEVESAMTDDGLTLDQVREGRLEGFREQLEARLRRAQPVGVPPETAADAESVGRGQKIYKELCESCHGATGVGDGPSAYALRDGTDAPIRPRDFTTGVLRGGDAPQDIYRRLLTGLDGTPMPSFDARSASDLWDVVHFVMTLRKGGAEEIR